MERKFTVKEVVEAFDMIISELFAMMLAVIIYMVIASQWVPAIITSVIVTFLYIITNKQVNEIKDKVLENI